MFITYCNIYETVSLYTVLLFCHITYMLIYYLATCNYDVTLFWFYIAFYCFYFQCIDCACNIHPWSRCLTFLYWTICCWKIKYFISIIMCLFIIFLIHIRTSYSRVIVVLWHWKGCRFDNIIINEPVYYMKMLF